MSFANIHNLKVKPSGIKKIVWVPIMCDTNQGQSSSFLTSSPSVEETLRRQNFNIIDVMQKVRMPRVRQGLKFLRKENRHKSKFLLKNYDPQHFYQDEDEPVDLSTDPVEANRSTVSHVSSVFVPNGKSDPRSYDCPVNFLTMEDPYV